MWNAEGQANSFLAASPENERQARQASLTPSEALRMGLPFASIHVPILHRPSKNSIDSCGTYAHYKFMAVALPQQQRRAVVFPLLPRLPCKRWRQGWEDDSVGFDLRSTRISIIVVPVEQQHHTTRPAVNRHGAAWLHDMACLVDSWSQTPMCTPSPRLLAFQPPHLLTSPALHVNAHVTKMHLPVGLHWADDTAGTV